MNRGLFQGGGIAWQGWLIDVQVETASRFEGQARTRGYVVRMREGEVIEVHNARYSAALRRVEANPPAAASDS